MMQKLIRCSCGKLYEVFSMYVGDQSVCPKCRQKLETEYYNQKKWSRDAHTKSV